MVDLENVSKDYGKGDNIVNALKNINLKINEGEFLSIVGVSGCGKSTLLNIIGCVDKPTSGKVIIEGTDISDSDYNSLASYRNNVVGFVFQNFALLNNFTVIENLILPLRIRKMKEKDRVKSAIDILTKLDMLDKKDKKVSELSGGQQQRIAIGRALIQETKIILADEPTGALDEETGRQVLGLLKSLNRDFNKTIIIVTHNKEIAESTDRIIRMKDGKII